MEQGFELFARRMVLWVVLSAVAGIACGIFFGDLMAPLDHVAAIYTAMMQIAAIPYLISSILHGLVSVPRDRFLAVLRQGGIAYAFLLLVTFGLLVVFIVSFSGDTAPALVDMVSGEPDPEASLISRIVPVNIFQDAAQNYLPAVIVFSVLYGVAMQTSQSKTALKEILMTVKTASVAIWQWVVLLAPLAVFAVMAKVFGTTPFTDIATLSAYVVAIFLGSAILGLVVLPAILEALYPGVMRVLWPDLRNGLLIAMTTSLSVAALPFIQRAVTRFLDHVAAPEEGRNAITETTLSLSYPLAQIGNFFIWIFIVFSLGYYRQTIPTDEAILLPVLVLLSGIGSPSTSVDAVAFLVEWLSLPQEAVELYAGLFSITRYGQVLASVMGFAFLTVVVALLYYRLVKFHLSRALVFALPAVVSVAAGALAVGYLAQATKGSFFADYSDLTIDPRVASRAVAAADTTGSATSGGASATESNNDAADGEDMATFLGRIQRRGSIRVGYNPTTIPFTYENSKGELVGFDIEYAQALADSLNVKLDLVPFQWEALDKVLEDGRIDIAAAGIYVTDSRLEKFLVSDPYFESPLAVIVPSAHYQDFLSREAILARPDLEVTVFNDPVMETLAKYVLPGAKVRIVPNYYADEAFGMALWTMDQAGAYALTRRQFTAVRPSGLAGTLLFAYLMPPGAAGLHQYVNYWQRLQRENGFHQRMIEKWIKANPNLERGPRWSILRNVIQAREQQPQTAPEAAPSQTSAGN